MPADKERAAAVVIATLPGAVLWHEGQFEGRRVRPPVFLARRPDEPTDDDLRDFYLRLVDSVHSIALRVGRWELLDCTGWPDNPTHHNLLGWCWTDGDRRHLVVVNLSAAPAQGRVPLPWSELGGRRRRLSEILADATYERDGDDLVDPGLFVALDAWHWHLVALE